MASNKLTPRKVETAKAGKYGDGGNLWLVVRDEGTRSWVYRYTDASGRRRELGLGSAFVVTLAKARDLAAACRLAVHEGRDPAEARATTRAARRVPTFEVVMNEYVVARGAVWVPRHRQQWPASLRNHAAVLLPMPVDKITQSDVETVLRGLWHDHNPTAVDIQKRIEAVLDYALAKEYMTGENVATWKGRFEKLMPKPADVYVPKQRPAMRWQEVPAFLARLREVECMNARALELLLLCGLRSQEVWPAVWDEIDLDRELWTIPRERMKGTSRTRQEHEVPLSPQAMALLCSLPRIDGEVRVFPGATGKGMRQAMVAAGGVGVPHGLRSCLRSWVADASDHPREVAEAALAHVAGKVEQAYLRVRYFAKRRRLMNSWGAFCDSSPVAAGEVVAFRAVKEA